MLEALGVESWVERVYRALLSHPGSSEAQLAEELELPTAEVQSALQSLVATGLALKTDETYVAAPPAVALGAMISERRDELRLAEHALASFAEEHRAALAGGNISQVIEVVTGADPIRHRYRQVQQAATSELRMFVTAPFVVVPPGANDAESAAADRGVRIRCVLERAVLAEPGAAEELVESLRRGLEVRVVETLPLKLVLADAELALVPLAVAPSDPQGDTAEDEPGAVLLHRSGLLAALEALFEDVWRRGYPLGLDRLDADGSPEAEDLEGPTALDRQILSLLLAGLTDQAVATQLDLSLRTVQRRLRHLQDLAGVSTRMQLGWYASQQAWA